MSAPEGGGARGPAPARSTLSPGSWTLWGGTPRETEQDLEPAPQPCTSSQGRPGSTPRGRAARPQRSHEVSSERSRVPSGRRPRVPPLSPSPSSFGAELRRRGVRGAPALTDVSRSDL